MKRTTMTLITALLASTAWLTIAQNNDESEDAPREGRRGPGGRGDFTSRLPLYKALDVDKNNELSAEEIEGAVAALKTLDADGDGKLTGEEFLPVFGGRGGAGAGGRVGGRNRGDNENGDSPRPRRPRPADSDRAEPDSDDSDDDS